MRAQVRQDCYASRSGETRQDTRREARPGNTGREARRETDIQPSQTGEEKRDEAKKGRLGKTKKRGETKPGKAVT
jgi:hypothetical protein